MEEIAYIVTLYREEDLPAFYTEMAEKGFRLHIQRPLSRNTHYWMTASQAEELRQDERVWDVVREDSIQIKKHYNLNYDPESFSGTFWKSGGNSPTMYQWGHLHCSGDQVQRRKNVWSSGTVTDTATYLGDGKHVDVIIVDDPVSYDCEEWNSPSTGDTRFVQYQWFNELNSVVLGLNDLDGQTQPTGNVTYYANGSNPEYHGNHVAGTVAGQHYGWAREANIYGLQVLGTMPSGQTLSAFLVYDYIRAFHRNKAVNPVTGLKNPTITNHSYGGIVGFGSLSDEIFNFNDLSSVNYNGVVYNAGNPGPNGWTEAGVRQDFGVEFNVENYPGYNSNIIADVQAMIADGVVMVGAAGNDNLLMSRPADYNWNNTITITGFGTIPYQRGAWPNAADGNSICVGALDTNSDFRRTNFTQYGTCIDVFAPGRNILSAFNNQGTLDGKYGGQNFYGSLNGTSMASPQVAGVLACVATGKPRFTQFDALGYLQQNSIEGDMTFDTAGGHYADSTARKNSKNRYLHIKNPRPETGFMFDRKHRRKDEKKVDVYEPLAFPRRNVLFTQNSNVMTSSTDLSITKSWSQGTYTWQPQIHMPTTGTAPYGVVILLHGAGGTGGGMISQWSNVITDQILVAPTGYNNVWNIIDESDAPDYDVLEELIEKCVQYTNVDATKIRFLGISNGGAMALRMGMEYSVSNRVDIICSIISQCHDEQYRGAPGWFKPSNHENTDSTNTNAGYDTSYTPNINPTTVPHRYFLCMNTVNDNVIPYNGGTVNAIGTTFLSAPNSAYRIAQAAGWQGSQITSGRIYSGVPAGNYQSARVVTYEIPGIVDDTKVDFLYDASGTHQVTSAMTALVGEYFGSNGNSVTIHPQFIFDVGNSGASHYTFTGSDRVNTFNNVNDPQIQCNAGDELIFNVNASGHPFFIKNAPTLGTGNQVTAGSVTNQGASIGTVTWNTYGVTPGTYYYICQFHGGMVGQIVIS
tara:strand:+ start:419 stop:3340 length:2922 start_codon:yes stop_codon:yes gene_type:complete